MNKKILAPIATAIGMATLAVGTTFALFSSNSSSEIDVTAGIVKVDYTSELLSAESRFNDAEPFDAISAAEGGEFDAVFENGGTAKILEDDSTVIELDRMAPMDRIFVKATATNASNINMKYRYVVKLDGELIPALNINIDGTDYTTTSTHESITSIWSNVMSPDVEGLFTKDIKVEFPYGGEEQNEFQGKTCTIEIAVEAVQGNATVINEQNNPGIPDIEETHSEAPSGGDKSTILTNSNATLTARVFGDSVANSEEELVFRTQKVDTPKADVGSTQQSLSLDLDISNIKDDNEIDIAMSADIGTEKTGVEVYHEGSSIESQYDSQTGVVTWNTKSCSQFDIVWDTPLCKDYGFYNSYVVDEGLETEHWVHEISNADEFRNIVDSTTYAKKAAAFDYPGAHKEETVYLIVDDIDFDGEVWNTPELVNEVNAYPFIGNLIGDGEGATLSNVHVTSLYNGLDDNSMFCFFSRAVNASFENLTLKDCTLSNALGDKCAILVGGNKTTEASYKTLFGDDNFAIKYLTFKNVLVDSTCSVSCSECAAGVCAVLRYFRADGCITFENVVNLADISASKGNVGGILGQMSLNPANNQHLVPTYFTNCENSGTIEGGSGNVGGLVGYLCSSTAVVKDCSNHGDINFNNTSTAVGAISGSSQNGTTYVNCTNDGFIYTKGSSCNDFTHGRVVLYNEKGTDEVSLAEYNSLFLKPYVGNEISVSLNKDSGKIEVDTSDGADHYSLVITATKVDIDASTNKACADRSGTVIIAGLNNISPAEVTNLSVINQLGYFAPGPGECPVDEHHGGTRIGSLGIKTTSEYFLDYALHGTEGYEAGYGVNSKGGYVIYDNTGNNTGYWQCLITWRLNISYSFVGYNSSDEVISRGSVTDSPYALGGDKNYVTSIVGYTPDVE